MSAEISSHTVEKLLRQQAALAQFGGFAFREPDLKAVLTEAARICAVSLDVPFSKVCRYRSAEDDLLIEAGWGWKLGVVGRVVSQANESSPQGRAYVTGKPVIIRNLHASNNLALPPFYAEHGIISTVDVVIPSVEGAPWGVLEVDSPRQHQYDIHDISFLTGFANVLAEAVATATRVRTLQSLIEAKELLALELQHRVRNNLHLITTLLDNYARTSTVGAARDGIELIIRKVSTLAQVYDSLLGVGLSNTVDLSDYLQALCLSLPELQAYRERPVSIVCRAERVMLGLDEVTSLGMAVAELVTNSYGHAFPDSEGSIVISLMRVGSARATITIEDNGIGFELKAESNRHGLGLVRRLMEHIGGSLEMRSGDGTRWTLAFPVPVPSNGTRAAA